MPATESRQSTSLITAERDRSLYRSIARMSDARPKTAPARGTETPIGPVERAARFAPTISALADQIESNRRLPASLVLQLTRAGLFKMLTPKTLGGLEVDVATFVEVVEAFSALDGSVGWLLLGNAGGLCTGYLDQPATQRLFDGDGEVVIGGTLVPKGRAIRVAGGYRVSGRWGFASGVDHCRWMMVGCQVIADTADTADTADSDRPTAPVTPGLHAMFVPTDQLDVVDTWSVSGLRGTGSHDIVATDIFVPDGLSFVPGAQPQQPGPLYRFPIRSLGAAGIAGVCLGIARGAIDAFVELAATKTPTMATAALGERVGVQIQLAEAEALVRSSRAWLLELLRAAWQRVERGLDVPTEQQLMMRLAATNACVNAARAVDVIHAASGGTAIYTSSPIERAFRDVHTAKQHFSVQQTMYEQAGRGLLGLPALPGPPL